MANGAFAHGAIISSQRCSHFLREAAPARWAVSPAGRREMETDMNIFGSRGGNETPEFAPRDGAPAFSEIGAVLAAGVVLGLAFLILS